VAEVANSSVQEGYRWKEKNRQRRPVRVPTAPPSIFHDCGGHQIVYRNADSGSRTKMCLFYSLSIRSPPERLFDDELLPLRLKPSFGCSRSWTATLGACGTGSFLCAPFGRLMMSLNEMPLLLCDACGGWLVGNWLSGCGSRGASAGVVCVSERFRKGGKSYVPTPLKGRRRGE
jgi:hypothetical protein